MGSFCLFDFFAPRLGMEDKLQKVFMLQLQFPLGWWWKSFYAMFFTTKYLKLLW